MGLLELLQWWNLIYLLPLALAFALILGSALSLGGNAEGGDGADADIPGADVPDADVPDADVPDAEPGGDADGGDGDHDGPLTKALDVLGVGRVPITIVLGTLLLLWGSVGLLLNQLLGVGAGARLALLPPSLAASAVVSVACTGVLTRLVARVMPGTETYACSRHELVGRTGSVVYSVTETGGTVQVADASGTLHRMLARTPPGADPLPAGSRVLVVEVDEQAGRCIVEAAPVQTDAPTEDREARA